LPISPELSSHFTGLRGWNRELSVMAFADPAAEPRSLPYRCPQNKAERNVTVNPASRLPPPRSGVVPEPPTQSIQ
jgi:hypothetical protein